MLIIITQQEFDSFKQYNSNKRQKAIISNVNFRNRNFRDIDLSMIRFCNCDFSGSVFTNCNLASSELDSCNLNHTFFGKSKLSRLYVYLSSMKYARVEKSNLRGSYLYIVSLDHTSFTEVNLMKVEFGNCNLDSIFIFKSNIEGVNFIGCAGHSRYIRTFAIGDNSSIAYTSSSVYIGYDKYDIDDVINNNNIKWPYNYNDSQKELISNILKINPAEPINQLKNVKVCIPGFR